MIHIDDFTFHSSENIQNLTYIYIYIYIYCSSVMQSFLHCARYIDSSVSHSCSSILLSCCYVLTFWPGQKCHSRWCTGRKWHILMAVMRGNRVDGNRLMKWDELKKIPWYSHRLTHRKRVTCELHDSYFRLMTIKHSISKIVWAIKWALNYYIAQSRQNSRQLSSRQLDTKCGRESHIRPKGRLGSDKLRSGEDVDKMQ